MAGKERLLHKIHKDACLNAAALLTVFSVIVGTGYIVYQKESIEQLADNNFPSLNPEETAKAQEYIIQHYREYWSAQSDLLAKDDPKKQEMIREYEGYIRLKNRTGLRDKFVKEQYDLITPSIIKLAALMTLGVSFVVTRSGELFKRCQAKPPGGCTWNT